MRVLALTRYGAVAASARYRFYDLAPILRTHGVEMVISPLLPDDYVRNLRVRGARAAAQIMLQYARRVQALLERGRFDATVIQYEALPFVPAAIEQLLLRGRRPVVLDFDDAWFHRYDSHKSAIVRQVLGTKIPTLVRHAAGVIAGSTYLADFARRHNDNVVIIPTSIDLTRYPATQSTTAATPPVIGWVGSPATTQYLNAVARPLARVVAETGARLRVVGADPATLRVPEAEVVPWSADTEILELDRFDVGIMPLVDEPIARGKCAFKLIQYMGAWKPAVASPVGENVRVIEEGVNGFLASSDEDWYERLVLTLRDRALGRALGRSGRVKVESRYERGIAATDMAAFLKRVA